MAECIDLGWLPDDDPIYRDGWTITFGPLLNSNSRPNKQGKTPSPTPSESATPELPAQVNPASRP
jgi:hypothetical protein